MGLVNLKKSNRTSTLLPPDKPELNRIHPSPPNFRFFCSTLFCRSPVVCRHSTIRKKISTIPSKNRIEAENWDSRIAVSDFAAGPDVDPPIFAWAIESKENIFRTMTKHLFVFDFQKFWNWKKMFIVNNGRLSNSWTFQIMDYFFVVGCYSLTTEH